MHIKMTIIKDAPIPRKHIYFSQAQDNLQAKIPIF